MNLDRITGLLLDSVGVGLAIADADSLEVLLHNARFAEWFTGGEATKARLTDILSDLDVDRLVAGERVTFESGVKVGRRATKITTEISRHELGRQPLLLAECQNVSKIRELEYMIESYSAMIEKQNRKLAREKERAEKLLLNLMPRSVYEELKTFGVTTPQRFEEASILMLDFVGFTDMAAARDPTTVVAELNDIFSAFDRISEQFGCERIKTIGDAYMAVSGVPDPTPDHAQNIAKVALLFIRYLERRNQAQVHPWIARIGIDSGTVIGSIVGIQKYVYDIFGPGVNRAARMEAMAEPMEIMLPESMAERLRLDFRLAERGERLVKGLGPMRVWTLLDTAEPLAMPG